MSVNDDMQDGTDSFWELGKYMRTVKRCDNGYQLCNHLRKLIEERSEIEKKYSATLTEWAKKWNNFLDKGPEYGTTQGAWRGVLTEADHVADLHTIIAERLMSDVYSAIKVWQKENYHKSMMHFKETKDFEDGFRKAQKPWGKRLSKVITAKKEYHSACRTEKSTANQENNARGDTTVSQDQLKKLQDKLRKCQQEVESTREKYNAAVNDLNNYNAKYIEDMTDVYNRCQEFEQKRIDFFKKTLFQLHACLDLSVEAKFSQIYTSLHSTIGNVDYSKDLKWWSSNHGVDMAMNWPTFEEYSPELQAISKRGKSNLTSGDGGIVITGIKHSRDDSFGSYNNEPAGGGQGPPQQQQPSYNTQMSGNSYGASSSGGGLDSSATKVTYKESLNPFGDDDEEDEEDDDDSVGKKEETVSTGGAGGESCKDVPKVGGHQAPVRMPRSKEEADKGRADSPVNNGENPFGEAEEEDLDGEEPPSEGWAVRALYDYVKAEDDELEFKSGDIFTQVATEDEMGWCKGRKDGRVGFYPKNYVERL